MAGTVNKELLELAKQTAAAAKSKGAQEAAVSVSRGRSIELRQRDGKLERIRESASSSLSIDVYVDDRFSSHSTSDLRPEALERFVEEAVTMTRLLGDDKHRRLADPELYTGRSTEPLQIFDRRYDEVDTDRRKRIVGAVEEAAKAVAGPIISVNAGYEDSTNEWVQVHTNGFEDGDRSTSYWTGATVTVKDAGDRKPEDWHWEGARHLGDLGDPGAIGVAAAKRALGRLGQVQLDSGTMTVVVENRVGSGLLSHLLSAMSGSALQQKRSWLLGKVGEQVASDKLTLVDDPLLKKGFSSRRFDGDGISTRKRKLFDAGVLKEFLIDVYYANKLGVAPTGSGTGNLTIPGGSRGADAIIADMKTGVFMTGLLGGNSDSTTGDFSHGFKGYEIKDGELGRPIGEMNLTGSHTTLWQNLIEVGDDPFIFSSSRLPTLVFKDVSVSGT